MKAVILAGGLGTRIAEETTVRPKPMIEIGGRPILWHIMKGYAAHGVREFIVCLGYKGYVVKDYFANLYLHQCDVTFDLAANTTEIHHGTTEPWRVTLVDTGDGTMTGGRLGRVRRYLDGNEAFCMTYGDGVGDVDITALVAHHKERGRLATVTAVQPPGRFGALVVEDDQVTSFREKPPGDDNWINGGFFVVQPPVLDYISGDDTVWEHEPMERLAREQQLTAYTHRGFWHPMDTLRDKNYLENLWQSGKAPWRVWP